MSLEERIERSLDVFEKIFSYLEIRWPPTKEGQIEEIKYIFPFLEENERVFDMNEDGPRQMTIGTFPLTAFHSVSIGSSEFKRSPPIFDPSNPIWTIYTTSDRKSPQVIILHTFTRANGENVYLALAVNFYSREIFGLNNQAVMPYLIPPEEMLHRWLLLSTERECQYPSSFLNLLKTDTKVFSANFSRLDVSRNLDTEEFTEAFRTLYSEIRTIRFGTLVHYQNLRPLIFDINIDETDRIAMYCANIHTDLSFYILLTILCRRFYQRNFLVYLSLITEMYRMDSFIGRVFYLIIELFSHEYQRWRISTSRFINLSFPNQSDELLVLEEFETIPWPDSPMDIFFKQIREHVFPTYSSFAHARAEKYFPSIRGDTLLYVLKTKCEGTSTINPYFCESRFIREKETYREISHALTEFLPESTNIYNKLVMKMIFSNVWPLDDILQWMLQDMNRISKYKLYSVQLRQYALSLIPRILEVQTIAMLLENINVVDPRRSYITQDMIDIILFTILNSSSYEIIMYVRNFSSYSERFKQLIKSNSLRTTNRYTNLLMRNEQFERYGIETSHTLFDDTYDSNQQYRFKVMKQRLISRDSGEILGRGGYGQVKRIDNEAIKLFRISPPDYSFYTELERAGEIGTAIDNSYIIDTLGYDIKNHAIIMELSNEKFPSSPVETSQRNISRKRLVYELLIGVHNLHSTGIAHLDLKQANVLYLFNELGEAVTKIIDFGLSELEIMRMFPEHQSSRKFTPIYAPPEVDRVEGQNFYDYFAADIWSLGVILWTMFHSEGKHPYLPTINKGGKSYVYAPLQSAIILPNRDLAPYFIIYYLNFINSRSGIFTQGEPFDIWQMYNYPIIESITDVQYGLANVEDTARAIAALDPNLEDKFPPHLLSLLRMMLDLRFYRRPTIQDILRHEFFAELTADFTTIPIPRLNSQAYRHYGGLYQYREVLKRQLFLDKVVEDVNLPEISFLTERKEQLDQIMREHGKRYLALRNTNTNRKNMVNILREIWPSLLIKYFVKRDQRTITLGVFNRTFDHFDFYQILYLYESYVGKIPNSFDVYIFVSVYFEIVKRWDILGSSSPYQKWNLYTIVPTYEPSYSNLAYLNGPIGDFSRLSLDELRERISHVRQLLCDVNNCILTYLSPYDVLSECLDSITFVENSQIIRDILDKAYINDIFVKYNSCDIAAGVVQYLRDIQRKNIIAVIPGSSEEVYEELRKVLA